MPSPVWSWFRSWLEEAPTCGVFSVRPLVSSEGRSSPSIRRMLPNSLTNPRKWSRIGKQASEELAPASVLRAIDLLSEALIKLREGREERLMIELAVLKLTRPELADDAAAVLSRVEKLERGVPRSAPRLVAPPSSAAESRKESVKEVAPKPPIQPVADVVPIDRSDPKPVVEPSPEVVEADADAVEPQQFNADLRIAPTLSDLERIWPQLVAGVRDDLGARREALFREAMPGSVEGETLVLTVPESMGFHLEQLRVDDSLSGYVAERASDLLGGRVTVDFRATGDGDTDGGPVSAPSEPEEIPNKDSLMEAPAEGDDPISLLEDAFGATVVEEE